MDPKEGAQGAEKTSVPTPEIPYQEFRKLREEGKDVTEYKAPAQKTEKTEQKPSAESAKAAATTEEEESGADLDENQEEESATSEEGEEESQEHKAEKGKKKGGFQRRIEKLNTRASAAEQERDYWKEQALKSGGKTDPKVDDKETEPTAKPKPKAEDFGTLDQYIDALTDWKTEKAADSAVKKADADRETKQKAIEAQSRQQKLETEWTKKQDAAREKYDDYDEVVEADVPVTPAMAEVMLESEQGSELAYWLGKNPDEAKRIAKLGPTAAARELGKIEATFAGEKSGEQKETPTTRAPKPLAPVNRASPTGEKDPSKMTYQEHRAWREKQGG